MKRLLLIAMLGVQSFGIMAQKAVKVESPIVSEKDSSWYKEQVDLWKAETLKDPKNETAWENYYNAARYMGWWGDKDNTAARQAIEEMSQAIPSSYTFNYCVFRAIMAGHGIGTEGDNYAETAIAMLPEEPRLCDFDTWLCYLAMPFSPQLRVQVRQQP